MKDNPKHSRIKSLKIILVSAAIGLAGLIALSGPAVAAVQIGATSSPQPSNPGSVFPTPSGNSTFYDYIVSDGGSVTDGIPVQFCVTGEENTNWTSFQVQIGQIGGGGNLSGVTLPGNLTFTSAETIPSDKLPVCKTATIQINTGILTLTDPNIAQQFMKNLNIRVVNESPSGPNKPQVNPTGSTEIHLRVLVQPATSNISCFITDSSGNFLTKCDGTLAGESGSDAGRFAIVANKKSPPIEVSSNPGQFYYNVLYHNPGSTSITVDVRFTRSGVSPKGTQAIHAALFAPPFSGITQDGFNDVNNAIPEGTDDRVLGITIPAGWTLWVDYHLEWNGLGSPVPSGCATECPNANQPFSVTSTVIETGGQSETCTASAWGYKK
jgi:hypothetical protein